MPRGRTSSPKHFAILRSRGVRRGITRVVTPRRAVSERPRRQWIWPSRQWPPGVGARGRRPVRAATLPNTETTRWRRPPAAPVRHDATTRAPSLSHDRFCPAGKSGRRSAELAAGGTCSSRGRGPQSVVGGGPYPYSTVYAVFYILLYADVSSCRWWHGMALVAASDSAGPAGESPMPSQ